MQNESQPVLGVDPVTGQPSPLPVSPVQQTFKLIAPIWHTGLIIGLILLNSFLGSSKLNSAPVKANRILLYSGTFIFELILFLLIWFVIRRHGVSMRELIGGRWNTAEDFLIDVAIAVGFWIVSALILVGVRVLLGTLDLGHLSKQADELKRTLGPLIPRSAFEAGVFVLLSVFAGLFEEIIFRGYLQRQFAAIFRNVWAGIAVSAVIFGAAHGYQGGRMMVAIAIYGALFGLLAYFRKSLRPGMMAHAAQDAYSGIALFFLVK